MAGCAVGPEFKRPDAPAATTYLAHTVVLTNQRLDEDAPVMERWWELFGSPQLNALVQRALAANPTIDSARAALLAAQETAAAQRASFFPQVAVSLSPTRQLIPDSVSSPLNAPANPYSLHTAQLTVGYAPDVFGAARNQLKTLDAQVEFQRYELEAARLALVSNVVAAALQEASLRGQLEAVDRLVALQTETLGLMQRQFEMGAIAKAGVVAQEASLAQTRSALPALRKQLGQNRDLLAALAGGYADKDLEQSFDWDSMTLPATLPLSLPSRLVEQRPDILAAEALARSASNQLGVAMANRLPQFNIGVGAGSVATQMGDLFKDGTGFWSVVGTVTQPIFDAGALQHKKNAADAAYGQALAQYRTTVIAALQNVADVLHAIEQDGAALVEVSAAEQAGAKSLRMARTQVELGDTSHLAYLGAEQSYQQAALALVQVKANQYADTASLFLALGGGWWNRTDRDSSDRLAKGKQG
jgi:NodT family efflux transporter outer membrane factor (OMF) lipoprotein